MPSPSLLDIRKHPDYKKPRKQVFCLTETFLNGTLGHSAIIPAREPIWIPWQLFELAAKNGVVDYNPEMAGAMIEAIESVEHANDKDEEAVTDPTKYITEAVRKVMLLGDKSAFTIDNVPKLVAVRAFLDQELSDAGVSVHVPLDREIVYDVFLGLQDVKSEEPTPEPLPEPHLEGDESGGSVADMLERINPIEDY